MRPLTNDRWGFDSNCFVCERKNDRGLRIPFEHDEERDLVVASFNLGNEFSGAPTYLHGGVLLSILDEAMAWAAIAVAGSWAVTQESRASFSSPVRVGRDYRVEAQIDSADDESIAASARIVDSKERVCTEANATFIPLGAAQALDATGADLSGHNASFVKGD
ncbi:MAG TPA: PaaI family thioesterase [Acidimicrobiales bacterium]|nr:PaaI family thioesterase [Acidimicrobiales bacterium]